MHQRTETRVCIFFWARLASFCHLGFISDTLIVSKSHNETHDPKGQENKNKPELFIHGFYRRLPCVKILFCPKEAPLIISNGLFDC